MEISAIRLYLLSGLVVHKLVWEILKRQSPPSAPAANRSLKTRLLSLVKVAILAAIIVQTLAPEFLPLTTGRSAAFRIAGAALYTAGLLAAVIARMQLGRNWSDIEKSHLQKDHEVVAHGLYRWVRHPIYAGDLLLLIGLELALNSAAVFAAAALVLYVRRQAIREERTLLQTLPGYQQYYRRTARFFPFLPV